MDRIRCFEEGRIMKFTISSKTLIEHLEIIMMKGKYFQSEGAKSGFLTNYAVLDIAHVNANNKMEIYNADTSTACMISIPVSGTVEVGQCVVDINKTVSFLKPFGSEVIITISDFITIEDNSDGATKKATLPKVLSHDGMGLIAKMMNFSNSWNYNDVTSSMPTFSKTTFDTCVQTLATDIVPIAKSCEVVGVAKYRFDFDNSTEGLLKISSTKTEVEKYEGSLIPLTHDGECATVEFTGNFYKFLDGLVRIYMKDDAPILMVCQNRMLLKAPYLSG